MKRAWARALALVNWRGVFYERYLLDRHVTALEGDNGAGKTTVMVAAYLALFPDLSRLRFSNVGETGASGGDKGIWGRLGDPARPSYAALRLEIGEGVQMLAGVCAEKKAQPTIRLTPFIMRGLRPDTPLEALLLHRTLHHDEVPSLDQLRDNAAAAGAEIEIFSAAKDYFAALFDAGVTPLRLASDEERSKLNDMLRTSMTGGISRVLTSELRTFLLKQESGLGDVLTRMQTTLGACRKTRLEVAESRRLEAEISRIHEAGQAMFVLATGALEREAGALAREVDARRSELTRCAIEGDRLAELVAARAASRDELAARRQVLSTRLAQAHERQERLQRALRAATRAEELGGALQATEAASQRTLAALEAADAARAEALLRHDEAQATLARSAMGLADLQRGLEELHRRANARRRAERVLATARELLRSPELSPADAAERGREVARALAEIDRERARRARQGEQLQTLRQEAATAHRALETLESLWPGADPTAEPLTRGRRALILAEAVKSRAGEAASLPPAIEALESSVERQRRVREAAVAAGLPAAALSAEALGSRLAALDRELSELEDRRRTLTWRAREHAQRRAELLQDRQRLEGRARQHVKLDEARARLETAGLTVHPDVEAVQRVTADNDAALADARARSDALARRRREALDEATRLEAAGGALGPELQQLAGDLQARLLADTFEEIDPARAGVVEAQLGPWAQALLVDDLPRAITAVRAGEHGLDEIWLVEAGRRAELLSSFVAGDAGDDGHAVVMTGPGARITRIRSQATLGRAARAEHVTRLHARAQALLEDQERSDSRVAQLETARRDLVLLREGLDTWQAGDPRASLAAVAAAIEDAARDEATDVEAAAEAAAALEPTRAAAQALRALLPEAGLLDAPDLADRLEQARRALREAREAIGRLPAIAAARESLEATLDALRQPPPSDAEIARWREEADELVERRDRLFAAAEALEELSRVSHALAWDDAEPALASQSELVPSLEQQHAQASAAAAEALAALREVEANRERAVEARQQVGAEQLGLRAQLALAERERVEAGVVETTPGELSEALALVQRQLSEGQEALARHEQQEREEAVEVALERQRLAQAEQDQARAEQALSKAEVEAGPVQKQRDALVQRAVDRGLELSLGAADERLGASELQSRARAQRALLCDRLRSARGDEVVAAAQQLGEGPASFLELWLLARDWLLRRLPAQIAEGAGDQPGAALGRLREQLAQLDLRLARHEATLRGSSEDVARSIDMHIRRVAAQIRRLNQLLADVRFGSVEGIRVRLERDARMSDILTALRDGSAQSLLFQSALPFEEALDAIFARYGGGRSGGLKILDYRAYVELAVEVQRRGTDGWERANPSRVSTGEAIGVGAALMMVVLTEWERDARLLRDPQPVGAMRFLFLDEANRLSHNNLAVLFDLCQSLDLQLLIAAPEVAQAEGNTTYRLVRRAGADGQEEVVVTGRRASLPG